jgi:hypothetical protein
MPILDDACTPVTVDEVRAQLTELEQTVLACADALRERIPHMTGLVEAGDWPHGAVALADLSRIIAAEQLRAEMIVEVRSYLTEFEHAAPAAYQGWADARNDVIAPIAAGTTTQSADDLTVLIMLIRRQIDLAGTTEQ